MNVLVSDAIAGEGVARLRGAGVRVEVRPDIWADELLNVIGDYEGLIVRSRTRVTRPVIAAGKRLVVIGRAGSGLDNIDVEFARSRDIAVVNAPTAISAATAEFTIGMLFALARNIPQAHFSVRHGRWVKERLVGIQIEGKTLGILGFGRIGRRVAGAARALGMNVIACDPYVRPHAIESSGATPVRFNEVLARSDFISVHVPLTPETRYLLGRAEFAAMKDGVRIINCARGGVVNEEALYEALLSGKVAGAALDVFEDEPPSDSPLLGMDSVIATPHLGASSAEAQRLAALEVADRVLHVLRRSRVALGLAREAGEVPSAAAGFENRR